MRKVLATTTDGSVKLYNSATECAKAHGIAIPTVSRACLHGDSIYGMTFRYINPNGGGLVPTVPHGVPAVLSPFDLCKPAIRKLAGERADEALAWIKERLANKRTGMQVKRLFWAWCRATDFDVKSDDWVAAWKAVGTITHFKDAQDGTSTALPHILTPSHDQKSP